VQHVQSRHTAIVCKRIGGITRRLSYALLAYASSAQAPPDRLKQVVQPYVDAQMFMGSVLVAEDGKVISARAMAWRTWSGVFQFSHDSIQHRFDDEAIHRSLDLAP